MGGGVRLYTSLQQREQAVWTSKIRYKEVGILCLGNVSLWAHWIHSFHMHLSYLGPNPVSLFTWRSARWLLLAFPSPKHLCNLCGGGGIWWIAVWGALIHIWRPEIADGCDISCLLIWQEIISFHKVKNTCPPKAWRNALGMVIGKEFKTRQATMKPISRSLTHTL